METIKPLAGSSISKAMEEGFHALIYAFRLPIGLRVVRGAEAKIHSRQAKQLTPKLAGKYPITV